MGCHLTSGRSSPSVRLASRMVNGSGGNDSVRGFEVPLSDVFDLTKLVESCVTRVRQRTRWVLAFGAACLVAFAGIASFHFITSGGVVRSALGFLASLLAVWGVLFLSVVAVQRRARFPARIRIGADGMTFDYRTRPSRSVPWTEKHLSIYVQDRGAVEPKRWASETSPFWMSVTAGLSTIGVPVPEEVVRLVEVATVSRGLKSQAWVANGIGRGSPPAGTKITWIHTEASSSVWWR